MHLKSFGDAITATCKQCTAPRWMTPALSLFSIALGSQGTGFDILYAVVKADGTIFPTFGILSYAYGSIYIWLVVLPIGMSSRKQRHCKIIAIFCLAQLNARWSIFLRIVPFK